MSGRKFRLWLCRCLREVNWPDAESAAAVEVAERYADGLASEEERSQACEAADIAVQRWYGTILSHGATNYLNARNARLALDVLDADFFANMAKPAEADHRRGGDSINSGRLRDIFGNPFRPVAFSPEWRTDTAVTLARTMYESREFGAMPILADALQDAGCDSDGILSHCRDTNANHVRGCWVVDLVLGKE
jgi:hypothetical protein